MSAEEAGLSAIDDLDGSVVPAPTQRPKAKPPVPPADQSREVRSADDLTQSPSATGENGSNAQLLALAFAFHPFTALFERLAIARYPRKQSKRACVDAHANEHPKLYQFCVGADLVAVGVIVVIFVGTLGLGAWKTLFGHF